MSRRKNKGAKVIWRKLGKERAWGQATIGENLIEIDPRLGAKRQLEVLCHEQIHLTFPELSEPQVDRAGKDLAPCSGLRTTAASSSRPTPSRPASREPAPSAHRP